MRFLIKLTFILLLLPNLVLAQNLVPNPSFEDKIACPYNPGDIHYSIGWYAGEGSVDYFHRCASSIAPPPIGPNPNLLGVPFNFAGHQEPLHGDSYAGSFVYNINQINNREFIGCQLSQPLTVGVQYYVSAFISRGDSQDPTELIDCAIDKYGFLFSTIKYMGINTPQLVNYSHVKSDSLLNDSLNWVQVSGSFTADSAYQYLNIGNLFKDANTTVTSCSGYAYYYIDFVCVSTDSMECQSISSNPSLLQKPSINLFPNPAQEFVDLKAPSLSGSYSVSIFDSFGKLILQKQQINEEQTRLDLSEISNGLLLVRVSYQDQQYLYRVLKH